MGAGPGCPDSPGDTIPHAKWRMCPGAHPALCLATVLPGGLQGEVESSGLWYGRIPPVPASQRPKSRRSASWRRPQPVAAAVSRRASPPSPRPHPCCPSCRSARTKRDGLAPSGTQRLGVPRMWEQIQLAYRDRLRACPLRAGGLGVAHKAHALQRAPGLHRRDAPDISPERLGMEAPGVYHRGMAIRTGSSLRSASGSTRPT
jgi:hypothetical protein